MEATKSISQAEFNLLVNEIAELEPVEGQETWLPLTRYPDGEVERWLVASVRRIYSADFAVYALVKTGFWADERQTLTVNNTLGANAYALLGYNNQRDAIAKTLIRFLNLDPSYFA